MFMDLYHYYLIKKCVNSCKYNHRNVIFITNYVSYFACFLLLNKKL